MAAREIRKTKVNTSHFHILAPDPPYVDILIQSQQISPQEFEKIAQLAAGYSNDPRLVQMVRAAGDASAKVPYLLEYGETPDSILATLREIAAPHVASLKTLPPALQATIHTLLSINRVPRGCEEYALPALLTVDHIQGEIVANLRGCMARRKLAQEFHDNNLAALRMLDHDWHSVRHSNSPWPFPQSLPEHARMQFIPTYFHDQLVALHEECVIVDAPMARELRNLTAPVLRNPLPENVPVPVTGSEDWLLREVGKVGRHFTRALLEIIANHLKERRLIVDTAGTRGLDYHRLNAEAQEALRSFVERTP